MGFILRYSIFISSFAMAWFRMCSILRDGLTSIVFHPLWWFDYGCVPSFMMVCLIFGFFFASPLPRQVFWEEDCNIVRKRLPPPLQSCSQNLGKMYFVLLVISLIFNRRFLGFDSCLESKAPWLFDCIVCIFFCRRFLGFDSCLESEAPWL